MMANYLLNHLYILIIAHKEYVLVSGYSFKAFVDLVCYKYKAYFIIWKVWFNGAFNICDNALYPF